MDHHSISIAMSTRTTAALALVVAGWTTVASVASANDTLAEAKVLYASAAYDEALAVLDRLQSAAPAGETTSIAEYRVYCLLALDRRDEARKDIEGILHDNPQYQPSGDQASPRIQSVFRDVRRQSLPKIVLERYAIAKASFERKDPLAGPQFDSVLTLLDDPDVQATPALSDLRTVVTAFRDLTKAMAAAQTPAPMVAQRLDTGASLPPTSLDPQASDGLAIYTSADPDVAPPIARTQRIPPWIPGRAGAAQEFHGTLELLIDVTGAVMSSTMRTSAHPTYNRLLLRATREWTFTPARRQGVPVRYLKIVDIHLKPPA
jgi:tetratricopeptide (TPR) repeat protein